MYLEPSARVHYLAFVEYILDDLPILRARWTSGDAETSIAAFARKWNVVNDDRSFGGTRRFVHKHLAAVDPIRKYEKIDLNRNIPMRCEELQKTRSGLLDLATKSGYSAQEIRLLVNVYRMAQMLVDGGYRPCGRPFINHLVGTASVLLRYGFRIETVAAGMLHAAYSHCPAQIVDPKAAISAVCALLGGEGSPLEKRVRAYTQRSSSWKSLLAQPEPLSMLTVHDAEIIAIEADNEIEMHLSGEFRYSGRTDAIDPQMKLLISHVSRILGVGGLFETLMVAEQQQIRAQPDLVTRLTGSYRIANDRVSLIRMPSNAARFLSATPK